MSQIRVEFLYSGTKTDILCYEYERMEDICLRFCGKSLTNLNNLVFLYSGTTVNKDLTLNQIANQSDKERKVVSVIVTEADVEPEPQHIFIKSILPICPKCLGNAQLLMNDDFTFKLFGCKNKHEIKSIPINDYEKTQKIDLATITCGKCNNCIANTYNKEMSICNICHMNLCPLCRLNHDKTHQLIDYENKNYSCEIHSELYSIYCKKCEKNICTKCEREHIQHKDQLKSYGIMLPDKNSLINKLKDYKNTIDVLNADVGQIIEKLVYVRDKVNYVYKIYDDIVNKYEDRYRNNEIFSSLNNIKNNIFLNKIKEINQKESIKDKIGEILAIHAKITYSNDISITYINNNNGKIKLFDRNFVNNNKDRCKIIYSYEEYALTSEFDTKNIKDNKIEIKLSGVDSITSMNKMFNDCEELESLSNTKNWDTSKITDMSFAFKGCSSLKSLPDIQNWKTDNVEEMQSMFSKCTSLVSLPDISNWNTSKVTNMNSLFNECSSLISLPDISKWNTGNVTNMKSMFSECEQLISLPDISKWNTTKVTDISYLFKECSSLISLPDISKWNLNNNQGIHSIFHDCEKLTSLPDISKWNTSKIVNMSYIFKGCNSLVSLPAINKWDTSKVKKMNNIFNECKLLETIPDISSWITNKVTDMSYIFDDCNSLKSLPDISKWDISNVTEINSMFSKCKNLQSLPDISKWNTKNIEDMSFMFNECISLKSLPDISKWNIEKVERKEDMFNQCYNLSNIPDKFK